MYDIVKLSENHLFFYLCLMTYCSILICRCMHKHNNTINLFEGIVCERELETQQNCNILTPTLMAICVSFPFSWTAQPGAGGPASLGASFLYCILSLTGLVSKLADFLSSRSYIIVPPPTNCTHSTHPRTRL